MSREWKESQLLAFEKESVGFYLTGHPLAAFQTDMKRFASHTTETLEGVPDGKEISICGIIAGLKQKVTKRGDKMAIVNLEDLTGTVEVIIFPDLYATASHMLLTDTPLIVAGLLDRSEQPTESEQQSILSCVEKFRGGTSPTPRGMPPYMQILTPSDWEFLVRARCGFEEVFLWIVKDLPFYKGSTGELPQ